MEQKLKGIHYPRRCRCFLIKSWVGHENRLLVPIRVIVIRLAARALIGPSAAGYQAGNCCFIHMESHPYFKPRDPESRAVETDNVFLR
jgi:hypothetical protein